MKKQLQIISIMSMILISSFQLFAQQIPNDSLYLGQKLPENKPVKFNLLTSSGYFATDRIAISSDGKEIYFSETVDWSLCKTKYYKYDGGKWNGPIDLFNFLAPALSLTGDELYFEDYANSRTSYCSKKSGNTWNAPSQTKSIKNPVDKHYVQFTSNGTCYVSTTTSTGAVGMMDISKMVITSSDTTFVSLGTPLNSRGNEGDFYISRDESFIIFASPHRGGLGSADLFVSLRIDNSTWTNPKNLGASINTSGTEYGPYVTADNKFLFYTSYESSGIYWIRIDALLNELRKTNYIPYLKNQITNQKCEVGKLFNYTIPENTFIDDDGNNTLTYSAALSDGTVLPAWLTFNTATKTFSGTPKEVVNLSVKVTAVDKAGVNVSCTFDINIINDSKQK